MNRWTACLLIAGAFVAPLANASPFSLTASGGPVYASGEASAQFGLGRGFLLETGGRAASANAWLVRLGYAEFRAGESDALQFFGGSELYRPVAQSRIALRQTSLEVGLVRGFGGAGVRPSIEGSVGAGWIEQPSWTAPLQNDRRAGVGSNSPAVVGYLAPTLTLGAGVELPPFNRVGLRVSAAARWLPAEHFNGVLLPVRVGGVWPVDRADGAEAAISRRGPTLRLASGTSFLGNPARVRAAMKPSLAVSASLEQPLAAGLALSLQAEHVAQRDAAPTTRQVLDNFGNAITVVTGESPLSATLTTATLGVRVVRALGVVNLSARIGAGWGRSGGFGTTETRTAGYVVGTDGSLQPLLETVDHGAGATENGVAYSASAGFQVPIARALDAFAEAGALGLHLTRDDLLVFPVRVGLSIR